MSRKLHRLPCQLTKIRVYVKYRCTVWQQGEFRDRHKIKNQHTNKKHYLHFQYVQPLYFFVKYHNCMEDA